MAANRLKKKTTSNGATKAPKAVTLTVQRPTIRKMDVKLRGISPLITHAWSEKAKGIMRDAQSGKVRGKKPPKDPKAEFEASSYGIGKNKYGFPAKAFKAACASAATRYVEGITGTFVYGAFHVLGDFVEIKSKPPVMREDMVRVGGMNKVADIRYRAQFEDWSVTLPVAYNENVIQPEQILDLLNLAGFHVGVGEWRPERKGNHGMFEVEGV